MIKKAHKLLSGLVLLAGISLLPVAAFATTTVNSESETTETREASCVITGTTGPDSNNTCVARVDDECKVKNNTVISINNQNVQDANTGSTAVFQNTSGGAATSGNASNSNTTEFTGSINNEGDCVVVVEEEPEAPVVPETPAGGAGGGQALGTAATPKVLPATGTESSLIGIGLSAAVLAYITGVRLGRPAEQ